MKPMDIFTVYRELERIATSSAINSETREAVARAAELLCAVRSSLDLSWQHSSTDLYRIGCNVIAGENLYD